MSLMYLSMDITVTYITEEVSGNRTLNGIRSKSRLEPCETMTNYGSFAGGFCPISSASSSSTAADERFQFLDT